MASGLYLNESVWSSRWSGTIKRTTEGSWTYVEISAVRSCYQKFRSYYQINGRLCHPEEEEEQQHKGEVRFFENIFFLDFLCFW